MLVCKFCQTKEGSDIDMYLCDSCESYMCHECMYTSSISGKDYCIYCKRNLLHDGKTL